MKKVNFCLIFIILCILGGMASFVFPFYRANLGGTYGSVNVEGTIAISGISFLFGLGTSGTGYYENVNIPVKQNFGILPLTGVLCGALLLALILLMIRRKGSYFYFFFSCLFIACGIAIAVLAFFNKDLCRITLNSPLYPEFISETYGLGVFIAVLAGAGMILFGILLLIAVYVAIKHEAPQIVDGFYNSYDITGGDLEYQQPLALMNYGEKMQENFDSCEKELNLLKDMFENGMISQKEYDTKREEILARYFREEM